MARGSMNQKQKSNNIKYYNYDLILAKDVSEKTPPHIAKAISEGFSNGRFYQVPDEKGVKRGMEENPVWEGTISGHLVDVKYFDPVAPQNASKFADPNKVSAKLQVTLEDLEQDENGDMIPCRYVLSLGLASREHGNTTYDAMNAAALFNALQEYSQTSGLFAADKGYVTLSAYRGGFNVYIKDEPIPVDFGGGVIKHSPYTKTSKGGYRLSKLWADVKPLMDGKGDVVRDATGKVLADLDSAKPILGVQRVLSTKNGPLTLEDCEPDNFIEKTTVNFKTTSKPSTFAVDAMAQLAEKRWREFMGQRQVETAAQTSNAHDGIDFDGDIQDEELHEILRDRASPSV